MRIPAFAALLLILGHAAPIRAAESYDNCTGFVDALPAVISTQGTWCLRADVSTALASGAAITVATNNVTLDCNHFKLGGLAAGAGTAASGILAESRLNLTVRNCNVRGFYRAVHTTGGGGHLVEDNQLEGNTFSAIFMLSDTSLARRNQLVDTGGSTFFDLDVYAIRMAGSDNHLLDNVIAGVYTQNTFGYAFGIYFTNATNGSVARNAISGLSTPGAGSVFGIFASGNTLVHGNSLQGLTGVFSSIGVICAGVTASAHDNLIASFDVATQDCQAGDNFFNPN